MKFVNLTSRFVFNSFVGNLAPGAVSYDGGKNRRHLEEALEEVVNACGDKLGIRLNEREADLLNKLMDLDEKGGGFDPSTIPDEIRNDPTGIRRVSERNREAQNEEIKRQSEANEKAARREAEINGEVLHRKPVGPSAMEGEEVTESDLKSGFEKIMEENARIAAGGKPKMDVNEALDPIGAHAMKRGDSTGPVEAASVDGPFDALGNPAVPLKRAVNVEGDVARTADAEEPIPTAQNAKNKMDMQAAEVAKGLSVLSAIENPPVKRGRGAGKGGKKGK